MQLRGIDHVQALFTDTLEAWQDFAYLGLHHTLAAFVSGEIKIEMLAHETVGHTSETIERVFDTVAEQLAAKHVVVEGSAQRKFHRRLGAPVPEMQIIFPAGVKELPLKVGHLNQLRAFFLFHAGIFERHEEGRDKGSLCVAQIVKQLERLLCVCVRLSRQSNNEGTEWEPVVFVQNFHSLEHHVAPLMRFVRIRFALHENLEEARAAGFQTDDRISHALIGIGRFFVLHVREGDYQWRQSLNDARIFNHGRHCDVRHLQRVDAGNTLDALQHRFQRGKIGLKVGLLLVEEHVLSCEHDFGGALVRINAHALHDVLKRKRAADLCRRTAKLTAATTASGDLNYAKCRAMFYDGNLFYRRLHFLRHFDDAFERRISGHHALEEIAEYAFNLTIDKLIDVELIK